LPIIAKIKKQGPCHGLGVRNEEDSKGGEFLRDSPAKKGKAYQEDDSLRGSSVPVSNSGGTIPRFCMML
jgi:hypothetical protein